MLLDAEYNDIEQELVLALSAETNPRDLLTVIFRAQASAVNIGMPFSVTAPAAMSTWVMNYCLAHRWTHAPSLMELVLNWLVTSKSQPQFEPTLQRVQAKIDPNGNIYSSSWLLAQQPFFARESLRPLTQQFIEVNGQPVLRIIGPDGSGRSFTSEYFDYLGDQIRGLRVAQAPIDPGNAPSCNLAWLGGVLQSNFATTESPPDATASDAASELCRWALKHAMASGEKWVFVIDGINLSHVDPKVVSFAHCLAQSISRGELRKRMRLVLIAYDKDIPNVAAAAIVDETVPPSTSVQPQHLVDCITALNPQRLGSNKRAIAPTDIPNIAARILNKAPANGKPRLESIHKQLRELHGLP